MNCLNCNKDTNNPKFCNSSCAAKFNNKNRSKNIYKKVSEKLIGKGILDKITCPECRKLFQPKRRKTKYCSRSCSSTAVMNSPERRLQVSMSRKAACESLEERNRLKEIGKKGGFGKKGYIGKIYYESTFEKNVFEYCISNNIDFVAHKSIPNSSKVSDLYLTNLELYVELDGINREARKKYLGTNYSYWLNKLDIYKDNNLKYKIFYTKEEFINFMEN